MSLYRIIKNAQKPSESAVISMGRPAAVETRATAVHEVNQDDYALGYENAKLELENEFASRIKEAADAAGKNANAGLRALLGAAMRRYAGQKLAREKEQISNIIKVAKKITEGAVADEAVLKKSIEDALVFMKGSSELTVRLSADDLTALTASGCAALIERENNGIKLEKDPELKKGDVLVEAGNRVVDARVKEKLKNAAGILMAGGEITEAASLVTVEGLVKEIIGNVIEVQGLECSVGDMCDIFTKDNKKKMRAEVIGYSKGMNLLMPLAELQGVGPNSRVVDLKEQFEISISPDMLGRAFDGLGSPIDGGAPIKASEKRSIYGAATSPFERDRISEPLFTGIRAIDTLFTIGKGQRMGIFAGSGVGKSSLLGMMARYTTADVNVIALIGERGREVKDFIEKDLKSDGMKRSIVIAATSDKSPLERVHGALVAATIAEYFKDQGKNVLFMMDSVTRYATALREIGLATGEPPSTKGFTPSVFTKLPKLLERSGNFVKGGSITGFYTVLVEGDDMNEPIADAVRSILDGHLILSRKLASRNHYPAIEITNSISRIMADIVTEKQIKTAGKAKETVSIIEEMEDLINIGAYKKGANPKVDYARQVIDRLNTFLKQDIQERSDPAESTAGLEDIFKAELKKEVKK
jgi:flagellum-specific ATP synthase